MDAEYKGTVFGFICDEMLQKLARWLRISGIDVLAPRNLTDRELANLAKETGRVLLTRDRDLSRVKLCRTLYIRSDRIEWQLREVVGAFPADTDRGGMTRCPRCNGELSVIQKECLDEMDDMKEIPTKVMERNRVFYRCMDCGKYYWVGSHWKGIEPTLSGAGLNVRLPGG